MIPPLSRLCYCLQKGYKAAIKGTMEEKIYDRQVTKQSLSYRVVDQQQIERHFTLSELTELYVFEPDLLDDPNSKKSKRMTSVLPKDELLAKLLLKCKDHIVSYHEHESLLDHKQEEELTEAERKAAWAEYEEESKTGSVSVSPAQYSWNRMTNEQLLDSLNKSRANISVAFQSLQTVISHPIKDYIFRMRQQYPHLLEPELQSKAALWKMSDEKEQERRRAFYQDCIAQQEKLTLHIKGLLNSRRSKEMSNTGTAVALTGPT